MSDAREHIINTALKLFLQKSFKDVTMKELVESAGLSKGAFYHYFSSKEQVFEEVVFDFYKSLQFPDYNVLSHNSLYDFFTGWINILGKRNELSKSIDESEIEFGINHYYLIFDGLRLIPSFKDEQKKQQKEELAAWINIVKTARKNKEIESAMTDEQIARMFIYLGDGTALNLIMGQNMKQIKKYVHTLWNGLYEQLKP